MRMRQSLKHSRFKWLKIYVYLRLPVSIGSMLGPFISFEFLGEAVRGLVGLVYLIVMPVFLGIVTIKLISRRRSGWRLNWWLMGGEVLGVGMMILSGLYFSTGEIHILIALAASLLFTLVWSLPNGVYLYNRRSAFSEG
jgi:hypothetical protein